MCELEVEFEAQKRFSVVSTPGVDVVALYVE